MRICVPAFAALLALPLPVAADCAAEVAGLFQGGALDPFARPNRHEVTVAIHPDGSQTAVADVLWDGVARSANCTPNGCFLSIDAATWQGEGFAGPWVFVSEMAGYDPEPFTRAMNDSFAANVTEAECQGAGELEGRAVVSYRYRTRTDPNEYGSWFGGLYTAWIEVETGQLMRLAQAEGIASWAPEPSGDLLMTDVVYDPAIRIETPPR